MVGPCSKLNSVGFHHTNASLTNLARGVDLLGGYGGAGMHR